MNQNKPAVVKKLQERFRNVSVGRGLYIAGIVMCLTAAYFLPESSFDDELGCF